MIYKAYMTCMIFLVMILGVTFSKPQQQSTAWKVPCTYGTVYYDNGNGPAFIGHCPDATPRSTDYRYAAKVGAQFIIVDPATGREIDRFDDPRFMVFPLEVKQ